MAPPLNHLFIRLEFRTMADEKSYYGGFFWIAAVSFVVPLFVAWSAFRDLQSATKRNPIRTSRAPTMGCSTTCCGRT